MDTARTKNYLTVDAVGKMSTYELRQEAEKRGLLEEIPIVNHAALLRRLVQASTYRLIIGLSRYKSGCGICWKYLAHTRHAVPFHFMDDKNVHMWAIFFIDLCGLRCQSHS